MGVPGLGVSGNELWACGGLLVGCRGVCIIQGEMGFLCLLY